MRTAKSIQKDKIRIENKLFEQIEKLGYNHREMLANEDMIVLVVFPQVDEEFRQDYWNYRSIDHYLRNYDFYKNAESNENSRVDLDMYHF